MNASATFTNIHLNPYPVSNLHLKPLKSTSTVTSISCKHRLPLPSPAAATTAAAVQELDSNINPETVTRRLILLRHAKSSWDDPSLRDHDRPLSKAGHADAVKLSSNLQRLSWIPQLVLCSDALRSRQTLEVMQQQVKALLDAQVHFISSFYSIAAMDGQTANHLQQAICAWDTIGVGRRQPQCSLVPLLNSRLAMLLCSKQLAGPGKRHFHLQALAGGSYRGS